MADYLLSANRFMTDTLYKHAFMLEGIFQGKILELGYPRIDTILNSNTAVVYKRLENCGFDTNKKSFYMLLHGVEMLIPLTLI